MEAIEEAGSNQPKISLDLETVQKIFKDMPLDCQLQLLAQYGFEVPELGQAIETEQLQNAKI